MPIDLASPDLDLELRDPGIWMARRRESVSYPGYGNAACLAVEDRSFWFSHRNRCIVNLVRRFAPDGAFLDIGAGNGYVARGLIEAGIDCILLEPGIDGALAARARGIDPVICARLEDLALPPARIAAAGMFDVLEHIEDDAATLRHVHRLLRPDGRLFLTVPAYPFLTSVDDVYAGHFRRYTTASIGRVLAEAGFRIEFASYIFAALPPIIFLLRTLPSWLGLRRETGLRRDASEHTPHGLAVRMMERLLDIEWHWLLKGRTIPSGGSCLCVAVKV
jgi:SAM-dependent methyltransferase